MTAYYNEIDPFAAQWLRNLIAEDLIAPGDVDERDIREVPADDLEGYDQCHFFAGMGGWAFGLRLAGKPDDWPVWTGSCPCQDFALIGKREGFNGHRDLWPDWFRLIRERRPGVIFGEQVDDAPEWTDRTVADLEGIGYACGPLVIPAVSVGSWMERARLFFVADADKARWSDPERLPAAEALTDIRPPAGVVHCPPAEHIRGPFIPDESWIVDGLSGEGYAVGALGNAIHPRVAAEFITAFSEIADH